MHKNKNNRKIAKRDLYGAMSLKKKHTLRQKLMSMLENQAEKVIKYILFYNLHNAVSILLGY